MGEVSRGQALWRLRQEVSRKVSFLKHKAIIDYHDVYALVRNFFKEYLDRRYEFTVSELHKELQSTYFPVEVRDDVHKLLEEIRRMEYSSVSYGRDDLAAILDLFESVVQRLVRRKSKTRNLLGRLRAFFLKEEDDDPIILSELPALEDSSDAYVHLNVLLERFYVLVDKKKPSKARKQYEQLLSYYDSLPEDLRAEYYPLVDEAYRKLVEAV